MASRQIVHLVILIHGLWGSPAHLFAAKEELEKAWKLQQGIAEGCEDTEVKGPQEDPTIATNLRASSSSDRRSPSSDEDNAGDCMQRDGSQKKEEGDQEELVVVIAGGMTSQLTYDGIDVCASRVAWEVDQEIEKLEAEGKRVSRFSVTGYSLGGLVARYLIGLLESRSPSFFEKHRPVSFSTIATPHLGVPLYNTLLSTVLVWLGSRLLSRSGEQLYVADQYSDEDQRPLLEIMADPNLIFSRALQRFSTIQIFANAVNDHTVPYPSAAIETTDHFAQWDAQGLTVNSGEDDVVVGWSAPSPEDATKMRKKGWGFSLGTLPPVLRYRFPFNYIILLLFPIMLPLVIVLMISRLALDTRRSRRRLQKLAQSTSSPSPSSAGTSIQSLRQAIRRVERELESDFISSLESPTDITHQESHHSMGKANHSPHPGVKTKVELNDSQLRMALWLNKLPLKKYISWYPDIANAHSLCVVRDPKQFPIHNRGRGFLRQWAKGVLAET